MKWGTLPTIPRPSTRVRFKNILFATDLGTASAQAQAYAVLLARTFGSHLYVLHAKSGSGLSHGYTRASQRKVDAERPSAREFEELEAFLSASGVPYTLLLESGEIGDALNRVVEDHSIDMLILGTHGRTGVAHLFMGSTAEDITRSMTCPVITVGPQAFSGFENPLRSILVAFDFSDESKLAIPYATSLAQEFGAKLKILHVAPKNEHQARDPERAEEYLLSQLKKLVPQGSFPWCSIEYALAFGEPAQEIPKAARDGNADLLVMGLHRAVRFTSHLPERLSYRVLCEAPCPVLSVLPELRRPNLARIAAEGQFMAHYIN